MKLEDFENLAGGTILYVAKDGKRYAGHGVRYLKTLGEQEKISVMCGGKLVKIAPERLEQRG